jgi:hypothetical protein
VKTNTLIATINTCIDRLNTVKKVLKKESNEIEKNELIFIAVRHFVNKMTYCVIFYSAQFIKNENTKKSEM